MKTARSIIFTILIIGVAVFLISRHQQAANSPILKALAEDKAQAKPVWLFVHSTDPASVRVEGLFRDLQPEYARRIDFLMVDFDDPSQKLILRKFAVTSAPTSIYFDSSGKPVEKKVGQKPDDEYRDTLAQLLEIS